MIRFSSIFVVITYMFTGNAFAQYQPYQYQQSANNGNGLPSNSYGYYLGAPIQPLPYLNMPSLDEYSNMLPDYNYESNQHQNDPYGTQSAWDAIYQKRQAQYNRELERAEYRELLIEMQKRHFNELRAMRFEEIQRQRIVDVLNRAQGIGIIEEW